CLCTVIFELSLPIKTSLKPVAKPPRHTTLTAIDRHATLRHSPALPTARARGTQPCQSRAHSRTPHHGSNPVCSCFPLSVESNRTKLADDKPPICPRNARALRPPRSTGYPAATPHALRQALIRGNPIGDRLHIFGRRRDTGFQ